MRAALQKWCSGRRSDDCQGQASRRVTSDSAAVRALKAQPYFRMLGVEELARLARTVVERQFEKDAVILLEGEPCQGLYIVREGSVKIFKLSPEGREQILGY